MSKAKKIIQVFEYHTLKVDDASGFKERHFKALERYGYKTKEKYFSVGNNRIRFNNYVGVIQARDLTIEVLPKADFEQPDEKAKNKWHDALIEMLRVCRLIRLNTLTNARLKLRSASILDLYYDVFLTEVETIFKHGLRKSYRKTEENLNKVKGKILFTNHIRKNAFHKERFYVSHEVFDADNKLNRILLKALLILKSMVHNPNFNVRINKLLLCFEDVSDVNITEKTFEGLRFDRNTERYRQAIDLAKLIILRYSPDLKGGGDNVLAIMFDMNLLFEEYIYRKLKAFELNTDNGVVVKGQNRVPFWESRGLRADILVEAADKCVVIDTKWKVLRDDKPSDADLKQMFVYNLHYDANLSVLLYPKTTLESAEKRPFRKNGFEHLNCKVAFIDLFDDKNRLVKNLGERIYEELLEEELILKAETIYMKNRYKLLLMAEELHKRGYGELRVVPSLSPSGVYWRCGFVDKTTKTEFVASSWIYGIEKKGVNGVIALTAKEIADVFIRENWGFIELCKGKDETYTKWYSQMIAQLDDDELPYAFADYFSPCGFWRTSKEKEIETLPGEENYYFNY